MTLFNDGYPYLRWQGPDLTDEEGVFRLKDYSTEDGSNNLWWRGWQFNVRKDVIVTKIYGGGTNNNFDTAIFEADGYIPIKLLRLVEGLDGRFEGQEITPLKLESGKDYVIAQGRARGSDGNHYQIGEVDFNSLMEDSIVEYIFPNDEANDERVMRWHTGDASAYTAIIDAEYDDLHGAGTRPDLGFKWSEGDYYEGAGDPLTTRKSYVAVVPHEDGTMEYEGVVYAFVEFLERFDIYEGDEGEEVTHSYGGETLTYNGEEYDFLASGVEDPTAPGGYDNYTSDTSRTISLLSDRSNNVNFYYIQKEFKQPEKKNTLKVSNTGGIEEIEIYDQNALYMENRAFRVGLPGNEIGVADTVEPDHEEASSLRIEADGVRVVKKKN